MALYGEVLARLYEIGAVRNFNSPTGDIAEQLVAEYYGGTVAPNNQKSYDVLVGGHRLQVKARRLEAGVHRAAFSPHRTYDFEALVAVVFEPDMRIREAFYVPANVLRDVENWSSSKRRKSRDLRNVVHYASGAVREVSRSGQNLERVVEDAKRFEAIGSNQPLTSGLALDPEIVVGEFAFVPATERYARKRNVCHPAFLCPPPL